MIYKNLPRDVKVSTDIFRQSQFIESSIHNVQRSLLEGYFCSYCSVLVSSQCANDTYLFSNPSSVIACIHIGTTLYGNEY